MTDRRLVTAMRIALGALFIMAAWPKLADPHAFAVTISNYRMMPEPIVRILALVLPPLEMLVGVALILGALDAGASAIAFGMLAVFTVAVATALARGLDISCGCFDTEGGPKVGLRKVVENLGMLAAAYLVSRGDRSWLSVRGWLSRSGDIE